LVNLTELALVVNAVAQTNHEGFLEGLGTPKWNSNPLPYSNLGANRLWHRVVKETVELRQCRVDRYLRE